MSLRFSVVINTVDRAESLRVTLDALEQLDHRDFEVVVVNGPSTDATDDVLAEFAGRIKVGRCPERNLSMSRNVAIALAAGDVVAFIDDDAYPEPDWLDRLAEGYDSVEVAGVGGPVFDHTGAALQARYSIATRFGTARIDNGDVNPTGFFNNPYASEFLYLIGTNCSYRRDALVDVGGFDEEFEYYLDETDVCRRLLDRGLMVRALDSGFVYHKFLPSEVRSATRTLVTRYSVLKNTCYFALKHGLAQTSFAEVCEHLGRYVDAQRADVAWNVEHGNLTDADARRFEAEAARAFDDALRIHGEARDRRRPPEFFAGPPPFLHFATRRPAAAKLHVCYVIQEWPPMQLNGIARVVHSLATGLAAEGHVVHVVTRGEDHDRVDLEDGVWVHRKVVTPHEAPADVEVPAHIWNHSASMLDELRRIDAYRPVDVVQIPNWDSEGIAVLLASGFRTVLGLYTPLKTLRAVDPTMGAPNPVLDSMEALETLAYRQSTALLACGPHIVNEVEQRYGVALGDRLLDFVPHGLPDATQGGETPAAGGDSVNLLFVGRLEARKGIDTLLDALPPLLDAFPALTVTVAGKDDIPIDGDVTARRRFEESDAGRRHAGRVRFLGLVSDEELVRLYASCDLFVAPSRFESFGLILVEAMMWGKPVIGSRVGGMEEIVEEGGNGFLVPPGDVNALGAAITELLRSPELRERFGRRSRELYVERFTVARMVRDANRQYDRVASRATAEWSGGAQQPLVAPAVATAQAPTPPPPAPSHPQDVAPDTAALQVLDRLVCPTCRTRPDVRARVRTGGGAVKTGQVVCARCGVVAEIHNFKLDFRPDSAAPPLAAGHARTVDAPGERRLTPTDAAIALHGEWVRHDNGWVRSDGSIGDHLVVQARCTDATLRLLAHPYGGVADVFVDGALAASVDLWQDEGSTVVGVVAAEDLAFAEHTVELRPRGTANEGSKGRQVIVEEIVLLGPRGVDAFADAVRINRGNPYSDVIEKYLAACPADGLILEVGGGDRRRANPRHLNFEYLKFELADGYGDIHALPFADGTFSLVFSQAVFEHVANPFHAAEELIRVCRPGGIVLTEVAFMQPLHAVPYHFFNMTPWGVAELFKACEVVEADWFGELSFTVEWLMQSVGLAAKVDAERMRRIVDEFKQLDALVDHDALRPAASGVYLVVRKPA